MNQEHTPPFPTAADPDTVPRTMDDALGAVASDNNKEALHGSPMLDRMVRGAHQSIDRLAEVAAPHMVKLEHGVSDASHALHDRGEHWREMSDEWASVRTSVREHPLAALGIAVAAGMLIARLTSSR